MPYGAPAVPPDYSGERGLIGLFLCGSLANQFEKLYAWMNTNNFSKWMALGQLSPIPLPGSSIPR